MKCWVTKNGHQIIQVLGGRANVFLVCHKGSHLLIDTGRTSRWEDLSLKLDLLEVDRSSLKALILTHTHFDHAENAYQIKEKFKVPVIVQQRELGTIRRGENPVIKGTNILTGFVVNQWGGLITPRLKYTPVDPDITVDETFDLEQFGFDGDITHTPGHTAGSMSLVIDGEIALVGDTMYGVFPGSAFPPFGENPWMLVRSWGKLLATTCRLFLPSHGSPIHRQLLQKEYEKYLNRLNKS